METAVRYAHVYPRALELLGSGRIELKPLLTGRYPFEQSVQDFEDARSGRPESVKIRIHLPQ
ncbi:MAG: D-xylulose reductase [Chloroflexi bacterium]|nr:D-xylulose reductase [Chloroflexota bacterium]